MAHDKKKKVDKEPQTIEPTIVAEELQEEKEQQKENYEHLNSEPLTEQETPPSNDFQVLGAEALAAAAKRQKVELILPNWLAHPTLIEGNLQLEEQAETETESVSALQQLGYLKSFTRQALKQMKIKRLFPVQRAVIPWILEAHAKPEPFRPRDICVSAPTGSGKTLAFAIPIVQLLSQRVECKVRALVVLPVAELALQVFKVISSLCSKTELEVCLLSKQHRLEDEQDKLLELYKGKYYSKVDIVVTTPGRLVDHLHATKGFCLKSLQFLVIDEADRIMDAVFQNWLYHLDTHVRETTDQLLSGTQAPLCYAELLSSFGKQPHKLLFSATLSQDPEKLQNLRLFQPKLFTTVLNQPIFQLNEANPQNQTDSLQDQIVGKYTTPAELTEQYCVTEMRLKPLTLFALVQQYKWKRFLCFSNSADTANRLAFVLKILFQSYDIKVEELSGNMSALERSTTLNSFARGKINGLICSDALARGIDVADVDIVISYEAARHIKTYIHRVGRTARAGKLGTAVTLLSEQDLEQFKKMLLDAGKAMGDEISVSTDFEVEHANLYSTAMSALKDQQSLEKSKKAITKRRLAHHAKLHKEMENKDQRTLTLMEKLQLKTISDIQKPGAKVHKMDKPLQGVTKPKETKRKRQAKIFKAIEK
ncbi:probable ATP-dependent RNA helicase Dbp73D [Drosophila tropicalis]|uniref:probable ATP-dependent RNA helicase Dbp73D n=1 Tax=Drosophila tropicalis TaxID=46794 RepID=UPI0035ABB929